MSGACSSLADGLQNAMDGETSAVFTRQAKNIAQYFGFKGKILERETRLELALHLLDSAGDFSRTVRWMY